MLFVLNLEELTIDIWDSLVPVSLQANPYARSTFLHCIDKPMRLMAFHFGKGERIGVMIAKADKLEAVGPF